MALVATPPAPWSVALQLPTASLWLWTVTSGGYPVTYEMAGAKVFTNQAAGLVAKYSFRALEADWPPLFVDAFVFELASRLAWAVARDATMANNMANRALEVEWPQAMARDSQQRPARRIGRSRLVGVR